MKDGQDTDNTIRIAISAGEYSGDQHATRIIEALKTRLQVQHPGKEIQIKGMGGRCLRSVGVDTIIDAEVSGALNGLNIPLILYKALGVFFRFIKLLWIWRPDVLILVDYPDFNLRLAKVARLLNIPTFYYIPPKMWAWRSGRVKTFKKAIDKTATIFPFETKFFQAARYENSTFVGHPFNEAFAEGTFQKPDRHTLLTSLGLNPEQPVIATLAGSRPSELNRHMPIVLAALDKIHAEHPELQAIITFAPNTDTSNAKKIIGDRKWIVTTTGNSTDVMAVSDCGLLKSGTCNLEAAYLTLPFVCFYTAPKLSELFLRLFIKLKEFSLVNIIRPGSVREFIQQDATPNALASELKKILFDKEYRSSQKQALQEVTRELAHFDAHDTFSESMTTVERTALLIEETIERRPSPAAVFRRMLGYLGPYRKQFVAATGCMIIFGASDGALPFLVKHILDGIFAEQNADLLTLLPVLLILFTVIRATADFGQEFLMSRIGHNIVRDIRNQVNQHLLKLSSDFYIRNSSGALLSRFTSDVLLVRALLTTSLVSVIRDSIRIVALLITAIYLDPFLALIAFVIFPIGLIPVYRFGKRMRRLSRQGQEGIGTLSALIQETVIGHRVVKAFCREDYEAIRFSEENEKLNRTFVKSERFRALSGPVNEILGSFAISGVILYGGFTVISGVRSQGDFIAFLLAVFLLYDPFKKLSRVNSTIQQGASGAERIFELLDTTPAIVTPSNSIPLGTENSIDFDSVSFRYVSSGDLVLDAIQLHVPEGSKFALVGHSGAGKTTLVDLIPRFIDPTSGTVRIGGVDIAKASLQELRSRITLVSQHTFLFNDTVYNNIAYGKENATHEEILEAARAAHAYNFISALPNGFQTIVGQDGHSLSGGERQRISIARALLKNAPILILDEATASLDNQSEREVQAALEKLQHDRTTLVIAHRLSTVRDADCIIVMDKGKIVEAGAHQELLDSGGAYSRLHALQFAHQDTEDTQPVIN